MQARRRLHYGPHVQIPRAHGARRQTRTVAENLLPMRPPVPEMADGARRRRNLQMRSMPGDCLMNIILSIKPKWAEKIYSGEKTIEWRKSISRKNGQITVFIYETAPVKKITGFFTLGEAYYKIFGPLKDRSEIIVKGCVPSKELKKYKGKSKCLYGWDVINPHKFETPKTLEEFSLKRPPQSWCYTDHE